MDTMEAVNLDFPAKLEAYSSTSSPLSMGRKSRWWDKRPGWLGGHDVPIGRRIVPLATRASSSAENGNDSAEAVLRRQLSEEKDCAIQYRTCSWKKVWHHPRGLQEPD
jgi:hypothetical protein